MRSPSNGLVRHLRRLAGPAKLATESDARLLTRFVQANDEEAFAALVARHGAMVLAVCQRVLRHPDDAQDAAQATWLVLARKARSIRSRGSLAGWLHGVARQVASNALRGETRRRRREGQTITRAARAAPPNPLDELTARELLSIVDEEVQRLPAAYRLPVILCYLEGKTQEEAARELQWTAGSVRGRLERGKARLQKQLTRRGLTLSVPLLAIGLARQGAPAAFPRALALIMAKAAVAWSTGSTATIPAAVLGLVTSTVKSMAFSQGKRCAAVLLTVTLAIAGTGLLANQLERTDPPTATQKHMAEPNHLAVADGAAQPATDLYGDPLPSGALMRLGTVRLRHGSGCTLSFSTDGKTLISVDTTTARFWDPVTGRLLRSVRFPKLPPGPKPSHALRHGSCTLLRGGKTLAVWDSSSIRLWDIATGKEKSRFVVPFQEFGPKAFLDQFAVSEDGNTVALALEDPGSQSTTIAQCDLATGKEQWRRTLVNRGFMPRCNPLLFSPNGRLLLTGDYTNRLYIWDASTGAEVRTIKMYPAAMAFSPDSKLLVNLAGPTPVLWDVATSREVGQLPKQDRNGMYVAAFSPDGRTLAIGDNAEVLVYDVPTRTLRHRLLHIAFRHVAFTPDGRMLASEGDGGIRLWDVRTGQPMQPWVCHDREVLAMVASPGGKYLASIAGCNSGVYLWDVTTGRCQHIFRDPERWTFAICFSADGKRLISGAGDRVYIWDIASGMQVGRFTIPDPVHGLNQPDVRAIQLSPDGRRLAAISEPNVLRSDSRIIVWDPTTKRMLVNRPIPGFIHHWLSPDGTVVASPLGKGLVLQEVLTGHTIPTSLAILRPPLAFSPDSRLVAVGKFAGPADSARQEGVIVLERATGKPVCSIACGAAPLLDFAPDGRLFATADSKQIRLWDLADGKEVFRRPAPVAPATRWDEIMTRRLAFLPDGQRIARAMSDTTILIWDVSPARQYLAHPPRPLPDEDLRQLWDDLASKDAARAYQAGWALRDKPGPAIAFLQGRLHPAPKPDAQRLKRLIAELDSRRFAVHQAASQELAQIGPVAEPALRQALQSHPSAEMRRRLEKLLDAGSSLAASSDLRTLRAIAVLEGIGSAAARRLLTVLAGGASHAPVTAAARAALERLEKRPAG